MSRFVTLAFLVFACAPDPEGGPAGAGLRSADTGACAAIAVIEVAEVSCSDPPVAWRARDVEVYDGALLFEADGDLVATTGDCVAVAVGR